MVFIIRVSFFSASPFALAECIYIYCSKQKWGSGNKSAKRLYFNLFPCCANQQRGETEKISALP